MSENFKTQPDRPDRTLGDEWADWNGGDDKNVHAGPGLFLGFSLAVIVLIDIVLLVFYYLTVPRFMQFHTVLPGITLVALLAWVFLSGLLVAQLIATVYTGKNCFFVRRGIFFVFDLVFQRVFRLAKFLRISRDKMGHSFVMVSNSVVRAIEMKAAEKKVMILLPRCLTKEVLQEIYRLKEEFPVEIFTVSGGELARKKVKELRPTAIIGVACERDLVSGIRDVAHKIPVIGIPNERPVGPCKDTLVDIAELRRAVEFYLK